MPLKVVVGGIGKQDPLIAELELFFALIRAPIGSPG